MLSSILQKSSDSPRASARGPRRFKIPGTVLYGLRSCGMTGGAALYDDFLSLELRIMKNRVGLRRGELRVGKLLKQFSISSPLCPRAEARGE